MGSLRKYYFAGFQAIFVQAIFLLSTALALDFPHFSPNDVECSSCHQLHGGYGNDILLPDWIGDYTPQNDEDVPRNILCWHCHNGATAQSVKTHSYYRTSDRNGKFVVECWVCHDTHTQEQFIRRGTTTYIDDYAIEDNTQSWGDNEFQGMTVFLDPENQKLPFTIASNSGDNLTTVEEIPESLRGNPIYMDYAIGRDKLVRSEIDLANIKYYDSTIPKSGIAYPRLLQTTGRDSYADGDDNSDGSYTGVCEVCHTETKYHKNDGSGSNHSPHGPAGANCVSVCHTHENGFMHGGGSEGCSACHGHDQGSKYDPDMDANDGDTLNLEGTDHPGHGSYQSHSTHTESKDGVGFGTAYDDDKKGPGIYCDTCHDIDNMPKFKNQDDSGGHGLADTDICDKCHSPGGSYDGVDSVAGSVGAKNNWSNGVYNPDGTLKLGKDKWCVGCHDEEGSYTDAKGTSTERAPNIAGNEGESFNYGTGWGFYKTGHGTPTSDTYPASGGVTNGAGSKCSECHDQTVVHLDGTARTFTLACNTDTCTSEEYQDGYRLKSVDGNVPLTMLPSGTSEERFRLCFSCHVGNPGDEEQWTTSSRDGTNFWTGTRNDHHYHMFMAGGKSADHDWDGGNEGWLSCIICHNVHGTKNPVMIRDGQLTSRPSMTVRYGNACSNHPDGAEEPTPNNITLAESTKVTMMAGLSEYYCMDCHNPNDDTYSYSRTPVNIPGRAPELKWSGSRFYESDGVNPDAGPSGSEFTFRVKYSDLNKDGPPTTIQLWIDRNGDDSYDDNADPALDEIIDMASAYAEPDECAPYLYGVEYVAYLTLDKNLLPPGENTVTYKFYAKYNSDVATGPPTNESTLRILNAGPVLEWTGEPYYENDGVDPDYAGSEEDLIFRVKYIDDDDGLSHCPTGGVTGDIQIWIDINGINGYEAGEKFNLAPVDGDADCTIAGGGKLYYTDTPIRIDNDTGSPVDYNYRFYATDGTDEATGEPVSPGGTVTVSESGDNFPPLLVWESGTCRPEGAYPPRSATISTIDFTVRYYDDDNQCPGVNGLPLTNNIQVWVDLNGINGYEAGEKFDLTEVDDLDEDCTTSTGGGKLYQLLGVVPTTLGDDIKYEFHATDGLVEALGTPRTVGGTFDVIDAHVVVKQGGTYPTIMSGVANAGWLETVLVYDGTYTEQVKISSNTGGYRGRHLVSACGPEDTIITHTNATDPVLDYYQCGTVLLDGFTVTGGNSNGIYTQNTNYSTPNCRPTFKNLVVHGNSGRGITAISSGLQLSDSEIYENAGGGVFLSGGTISNSVIRDHGTLGTPISGDGAGISGFCALDNVVVKNNFASGNGGGIHCDNSNAHNAFTYEKLTLTSNAAGGIGGGLYAYYCYPTLINSLVSDNSAPNGGAFGASTWAGITLRNSTLVNNTATTGNGGAAYTNGAGFNMANTIAWGNRAPNGTGHIAYMSSTGVINVKIYDSLLENNGDDNVYDDGYYETPTPTYVRFGGTYIKGNYDSDPNFVNPHANGDYHIQSPSDAIDNAADNSGWGIPSDDLDGNSRPLGSEDIGAYEYQGTGGDSAPELAWTGQADYVDDGVNPDSGVSGNEFEFRVQYTHDDDFRPRPIEVWVDMNSNQAYDDGEKYVMSLLDSDDPTKEDDDYTNGEWYTKAITLYKDGGGDVNYRFYASDGQDLATQSPTFTKTVYLFNAPPVLSWVGGVEYDGDGVHPDSSPAGSSFTFRVLYTDPDNFTGTLPSIMVVYVDLNDDRSYDEGTEMFALSVDDSGSGVYYDDDFSNGEVLVSSPITINAAGDGEINYTFYAADGTEGATSGAPVDNNQVYVTSLISGNVYAGEGVTPIEGATVRLIVNGESRGTATTNASGYYGIETRLTAGDSMLVYLDGHASDGTTVTVSNGLSLSGLDIYADRLIVRHDNSGSLTNALMNAAKDMYNDPDGEILYSISGGNLSVSGSNTELFVLNGHTFAPGGDVTTVDMDINGTLNGGANAINVSGNWDSNGGSFSSTGTVTFNGSGQSLYGSNTFNNLTKTVASADNLTFEAGKTTEINGTVTLNGASGQLLTLASSSASHWYFDVNTGATKDIDYVDVSWSDARPSEVTQKPIMPTNSNDGGNTEGWFGLTNTQPDQPTNSTVTGADTRMPTLNGDAFSDPDPGDTLYASQWQISTATGAGFEAAIVYDIVANGDSESHTVTGLLDINTTYYWRVRYQDSYGNAWSDYSTDTSFTTGYGLPANALAYWKLDDVSGTNADDSIGSNDGTLSNATFNTADMKAGASAAQATQEWHRIYATVTGLPSGSAARTIEAWFKPTTFNDIAVGSVFGYPYNDYAPGTNKWFEVKYSDAGDKKFGFHLYGTHYVSTNTFEPNKWYHLAATYDGTDVKLYVNGNLEIDQTVALNTAVNATGANFNVLGEINQSPDATRPGIIDEVIVYDRALLPDEIEARNNDRGAQIASVEANDNSSGGNGIQAGDQVILHFGAETNGPAIDASNIHTVLALDNGHSWLDGDGAIGSAVWSTTDNTNDTLTITLSTGTSAPTVTVGDTVTLGGNIIRDSRNLVVISSKNIGGDFGLLNYALAYWKLDDVTGTNAEDSIGSNDGTLSNATFNTIDMKAGASAAQATADGQRVYATVTGLPSGSAARTIEAWFKPTSDNNINVGSVFGYPYGNYGGNTNRWFEVKYSDAGDKKFGFHLYATHYLSTNTFEPNIWYHLVATYDGTDLKLYVNNNLEINQTVALNTSVNATGANFNVLGEINQSADAVRPGIIDEVIVYDRALTGPQVAERFNSY